MSDATSVGDQIELVVGLTMAAGGDALGRLPDGRVVFVQGALPAESVVARVRESRRDYARATVTEVIVGSPGRVAPPCPAVAAGCGACGWQHASLELQTTLRRDIVADAVRRIARIEVDGLIHSIPTAVPAPDGDWRSQGDRTTAHVAVGRDGRLAYRRLRSHDTVPATSCGVLHPALRRLVDATRLPGATAATVRVGVAGGERLVVVDEASPGWDRETAQLPSGARLVVPEGAQRSSAKGRHRSPRPQRPPDGASFHENVGGRRWRVSARSFFQAGPRGAEVLAETVISATGGISRPPHSFGDAFAVAREEFGWSGGPRHVVDLYAGVGLLGGLLATAAGASVTAVESDPSAAADARHNLADLDAEVVQVDVGAWKPRRADAVVADPARPGLGRPGSAAVVATGAARVVLVSCDPASLGRDIALLAAAGYVPRRIDLVDLFPYTPHVETVTVLERADAVTGRWGSR